MHNTIKITTLIILLSFSFNSYGSMTINSDGSSSYTYDNGYMSTTINSDGSSSNTYDNGYMSTTINSDGSSSHTYK